jgi:hypothetical protein
MIPPPPLADKPFVTIAVLWAEMTQRLLASAWQLVCPQPRMAHHDHRIPDLRQAGLRRHTVTTGQDGQRPRRRPPLNIAAAEFMAVKVVNFCRILPASVASHPPVSKLLGTIF